MDIAPVDVTDEQGMKRLIGSFAYPLKGVFHTAGVSHPQAIKDIDMALFEDVLRAKVDGSWVLHRLSEACSLDVFVMFSSIASVWGSQHVASYAAANSYLDALAHHRRALGLPALSVNWGPWYVETELADEEVLNFLLSVGLKPLAPQLAVSALSRLAAGASTQAVVVDMDTERFKLVFEARGERPLFEHLEVETVADDPAPPTELLSLLRGSSNDERQSYITDFLLRELKQVLAFEGEIHTSTDVFSLGADSLMMMEIYAACKGALGTVPPPRAFFEAPTVDAWTNIVLEHLADSEDAPDKPVVAESTPAETFRLELAESLPTVTPSDLSSRVVLPDAVRAGDTPHSTHLSPLLLTGATGFVGAFILRQLLRDTEAHVMCLVRPSQTDAKARLLENLTKFFPLKDLALERVSVVEGDVAREDLGLKEAFSHLSQQVNTVIHAAASVNFAQSYEQAEAANVKGTQEVLRFCSTGLMKPLHYVSTYGVWGLPEDLSATVAEDDVLDTAGTLLNGYVQTKWVAEKIVWEAAARGLPVNVYRLGRVMGDSETGACPCTSFTSRIIKGCAQLECGPDLNLSVEMTPVDYVSEALVSLVRSSAEKSLFGRAYHLINPQKIKFAKLLELLHANGVKVTTVAAADWWDKLYGSLGVQENELHTLLDAAAELLEHDGENVSYGVSNTLQDLPDSVVCPPLDEKLLETYVRFYRDVGFLSFNSESSTYETQERSENLA